MYQIVSRGEKCEVHATKGDIRVGVVFVGSEQAAKQFVGHKIGGLTLVHGRLVATKIEIKHEETQRMRFLKKLAAK